MKISLAAAFFLLILCLAGCDILYPPIKVQFADTTITAPNGSLLLYGTVWQSPLDSATLARLRNEGYTGGTDKAPVAGAEVTATNGDAKLTTTTDRLGRYVLVTKNSGTYSLTAKHYTTVTNTPLSLDIKANTQKDILISPAKEFVFPLNVGSKWIYDYWFSPSKGTEIWEVVKRETISDGAQYIVHITGQGADNIPPYTTYSYAADTTIVVTPKAIIVPAQFVLNAPADTIPRFSDNTIDTLKLERGGLNAKNRYYVNKVGLVYYYTDGGSPASGRWSASLKLRSYTLK